MDYACRKLNPEDLDLALTMNRNFREGFLCRESARRFLENPLNWLFAAIKDETIIGFAYGYELNRLDDKGNMLYINEVGVAEPYQRQGVGYRLMTELKALCQERGLCKYFLSTYQNNTGANALYKKLGGQTSAESKGNDTMYYFQTK